jgi:serine/threonine protein kinase
MDVLSREITLQTLLQHDNLIRLLGVFEHGDPKVVYLVTEFADGGDLLVYLTRNKGQVPVERKLKFALDMASGLAYLHSCGVVHRDLKSYVPPAVAGNHRNSHANFFLFLFFAFVRSATTYLSLKVARYARFAILDCREWAPTMRFLERR